MSLLPAMDLETLLQVPQPHGPVTATCKSVVAVRAYCHTLDPIRVAQKATFLSSTPQVPKPESPIVAGTQATTTIGSEDNTGYLVGMSFEAAMLSNPFPRRTGNSQASL